MPVRALHKKGQFTILCCCWISVNAFLLAFRGIHLDLEAAKYIRQAAFLANDHAYTSKNYLFYSTQILLIFIAQKLYINIKIIAAIQILANGLSMIAFHQICSKLSSYTTASILTAFLILLYPYNQYNTYLQTETIYYALVLCYFRYLFFIKKLSYKHILVLLLSLTILLFTRPTALYLIIPTALFLFKLSHTRTVIQLAIFGSVAIMLGLLISFAINSGGDFNFLMPVEQQMVICGIPTINETLIYTATRNDTFITLLSAIFKDPLAFCKLCLARTIAFFGVYRNYFSTVTNIYNMSAFGLVYTGTIASMFVKPPHTSENYKAIRIFCWSFILITWASVLVTCDDWHNRFVSTLAPAFLILSVPFVEKMIQRYRIRYILP